MKLMEPSKIQLNVLSMIADYNLKEKLKESIIPIMNKNIQIMKRNLKKFLIFNVIFVAKKILLYVLHYLYMSMVYFTWKKGWGKILCNKCRIKYAILWNLEVWFLGWWSIYGFFYSFEALFKNITGGIQPEQNNSSLLAILAYDFYLNQNYDEAYKAINTSIYFKPSKESEEFREYLSQFISKQKKKTSFMNKLFSLNPHFITVPTLLISIFITILLFSLTTQKSPPAYNNYYYNTQY